MRLLDLPHLFRKLLHPFLLKSVKDRIYLNVNLLNSMLNIKGNKIFAVNHSCVLDAPVASTVIKEHFYFLVGKQSLDFIDRLFFFLNGVIYVDRKDKNSKWEIDDCGYYVLAKKASRKSFLPAINLRNLERSSILCAFNLLIFL